MSLTEEQQAIRSRGIGASEISALLGLNPWMRPIDVYMRKLGLVEDVPTYHTERGTYLEPALREWASAKIGRKFLSSGTYVGDHHLVATPDGQDIPGAPPAGPHDPPVAVLELKSPGPRTAHLWGEGEEAPDHVVAQLAQQQLVTGAPDGYVAALIDGNLRTYHFTRDAELEGVIVEAAEKFWRDHIEKRVPPAADGTPSYSDYLRKAFPRSRGQLAVADSTTEDLCLRLKGERKAIKEHEMTAELIEQQIKDIIGDRDGLKTPWGNITWRNNKESERIEWQTIAIELGAGKETIARHTKTITGPRVFRVGLK